MKKFITQGEFCIVMASYGSNAKHREANVAWANQVYSMTRDGGCYAIQDGSLPVLTKDEANGGWTFVE